MRGVCRTKESSDVEMVHATFGPDATETAAGLVSVDIKNVTYLEIHATI